MDGKDTRIWENPWISHGKEFYPKSNGVIVLGGGGPSDQGKDRWIWTKKSNGGFSCKSAYLIQALDRAPHYEVAPSVWNKMWNSNILECHKILWWCILSKAFPVRVVLSKRLHLEDVACPLCGGDEETIEHLFLSCNLAFYLWHSSPWGIFPISGSGIQMWDWVKFIRPLGKQSINTDEVFLYASIIVDIIWRTQNDKVHNRRLVNINHCIDSIHYSYEDYRASIFPTPSPCLVVGWQPLPQEWIKFNCDVKVGMESKCIAVVARNHLGVVCGSGAYG
ncbi:uncharacterized protein LOC133029954 [Cannabis sativa]|uniref:uncharacterized protein LOC133029954 n=1 Tax=Cannabis sativa TaxID=3483 RepID=UPI0029CA109C|nr:uncharacterized protein LOC133029954 [Cannabis sativa]